MIMPERMIMPDNSTAAHPSYLRRCRRAAGILMPVLLALSLILLEMTLGVMAIPDESYGAVINVIDGNTFDISVEKADPRIISSVERIRLADISSSGISTAEGLLARDFAAAVLLNKKVYLDIDDLSARDAYGRLVCVVYLVGLYGQPIAAPCFNRMLVDSGYAQIENSTTNEFNPTDWWPRHNPGNTIFAPNDFTGQVEKYAGDLLKQPPGKQVNELEAWSKLANDWLHNQAAK